MTGSSLCRWHGSPDAMQAALRDPGGHAPDTPRGAPPDPPIRSPSPAPGETACVASGVACAADVVLPLPVSARLAETRPERLTLLIGGV